jgi:glycosyltransferase involved in cell wall biosynthesis
VNSGILYLVGQLGPGGQERQLCYLLQAMDRDRYRPAVAVWNFRENDVYVPQIRALGVPLHTFSKGSSVAAKLRSLRRLVGEFKPRVVHSYSFYTNFAAYLATLGTGAVAVGSVRSDFAMVKKDAGLLLGRLSARWPRSQIFNSFAAAENARRSNSIFVPQRSLVVRNGLDLQRFRKLAKLSVGRACIVGVGSLLPVKSWDRLLVAALELKRNRFDFLLRIVGEGPLGASLEQQAQDFGVTDHVEFIGHVDDIPGLLSDATFVVHTSDIEGCPNVVMEAMACGRAVVATDVGDVSSLIEDGKTGFLVRCGDEAALVKRMAKLIIDRDLCHRMGQAGRVKAERDFRLERLVEETLTAYRSAGWRNS